MKIECGVDIIRISRIQDILDKNDEAFLRRVFTKQEIEICRAKKKGCAQSFAARFAAKEAVSKALGTGIGAGGVSFQDIEVVSTISGKPEIVLYNKTKQLFAEKGGEDISISLSHDADQAVAFCVMQFNGGKNGFFSKTE